MRERERECVREFTPVQPHRLMQVLPGHPLADPIIECYLFFCFFHACGHGGACGAHVRQPSPRSPEPLPGAGSRSPGPPPRRHCPARRPWLPGRARSRARGGTKRWWAAAGSTRGARDARRARRGAGCRGGGCSRAAPARPVTAGRVARGDGGRKGPGRGRRDRGRRPGGSPDRAQGVLGPGAPLLLQGR